jgi:hypothetical protein
MFLADERFFFYSATDWLSIGSESFLAPLRTHRIQEVVDLFLGDCVCKPPGGGLSVCRNWFAAVMTTPHCSLLCFENQSGFFEFATDLCCEQRRLKRGRGSGCARRLRRPLLPQDGAMPTGTGRPCFRIARCIERRERSPVGQASVCR